MNITQIFDLQGKNAIVTGATGAIGMACAQALVSFGANLIIVGRNPEKLAQTKKKLNTQFDDTTKDTGTTNGSITTECVDFTNLPALEKLFLDHSDASILVNSVGINIPESILDVTEAHFDAIFDANVKSAFFQTQFFINARLAYMKTISSDQVPTSSIIHISSQMGFVGGDKRSGYCASKHALEGMCKATALEIGKWNMRINTIAPTFIETELVKSTLADPKMKKLITDSIVFNRLGQTDDLYGAVVYLASNASKLVTGTSIKVDGGWTAR